MRPSLYLLFLVLSSSVFGQTVGLFQNSPDSYTGYTLFAPAAFEDTYLIDNCGKVINTWTSTHKPGLAAYILPDGDLLRTGRVSSSYFSGGGSGGILERYDWDGNLEWSFLMSDSIIHQHHDVEPLPNGNVLVITWERFLRDEALTMGRDTGRILNEIWLTAIFEIQPQGSNGGQIVWEWHLADHLIQDHASSAQNFGVVANEIGKVNFNYYNPEMGGGNNPDFIHANGIDYNEDLDQIAISARNFSEVWIIDHSTSTTEAASDQGGTYGKGGEILYRFGNPESYDRGTGSDQVFFAQHDAKWIPKGYPNEGQLTVFNNKVTSNISAVHIFDPPEDSPGFYTDPGFGSYGPINPTWTLQDASIYSSNVSGAQALPNGNLLICSGRGGLFVEYDLNKNKVWEYVSPVDFNGPVNQGSNVFQQTVFRAERYGTGYSAFAGRNLNPGPPVEQNPDNYQCTVYGGIGIEELEPLSFFIENPIHDHLSLGFEEPQTGTWRIFNLQGQEIASGHFQEKLHFRHPLPEFPGGAYMIHLEIGGATINRILVKP